MDISPSRRLRWARHPAPASEATTRPPSGASKNK